jgi:hypothetical protein
MPKLLQCSFLLVLPSGDWRQSIKSQWQCVREYDSRRMKRLPAPDVPGSMDAERMDNAVRKMFSVSNKEILKREAEWRLARARKNGRPRKSPSDGPNPGEVAHQIGF